MIPGYRKRIVTNQNALREKAIIFENELDDRVVELIKLLYLLDVQDKFPEVNIVEGYFLVLEGKYIIEFIGEKFLKAEIPLDLYKSIENNFAERLAAEVHGKAPVGIAAKDLFKRDLVDDARVIEAALPVGKGDRTAAPEPRGDGWNLCRIGEHALSGKHQILIDVLALQCGQTARSAGHIGERHALRRDGGRR